MSYGDQGTYDDTHPEYHHHDGQHYQSRVSTSSSHSAECDHAMVHLPRPSFDTFAQSNYPQHQLSYHQNYPNMEFSYDPNYVASYPSSSSYLPQRLTPHSHPRSQSQQLPSPAEVNASQRVYHYQNQVPSGSHPAEYDHALFHHPQPSLNTFVQSNYPQRQLLYLQNYQDMKFSYDPNYLSSYPSSPYPSQRLVRPYHPYSQSQQPSRAEANAGQRLTLAGSLDPSTGIFYHSPEHLRLRTAQACERCRTRKAKCSGEHPSCERCLTRGLICQYAREARIRRPKKPKNKARNSNSESPSSSTNSNPSSFKGTQSTDTAATTPSLRSSDLEGPTIHKVSSAPTLSMSFSSSSAELVHTPASDSPSPSSVHTSPLSAGSGSRASDTSPPDVYPQLGLGHDALSIDEHRGPRSHSPDLRPSSSTPTSRDPQSHSARRQNMAVPSVQGYPMTPSLLLDMQSHSTSPRPELWSTGSDLTMGDLRVSMPNDERFPNNGPGMLRPHRSLSQSSPSLGHHSPTCSQSSSLSSLSTSQLSLLSPLPMETGHDEERSFQWDPSPRSTSSSIGDSQAPVSCSDEHVHPDSLSQFESYSSDLRAGPWSAPATSEDRVWNGLGTPKS